MGPLISSGRHTARLYRGQVESRGATPEIRRHLASVVGLDRGAGVGAADAFVITRMLAFDRDMQTLDHLMGLARAQFTQVR